MTKHTDIKGSRKGFEGRKPKTPSLLEIPLTVIILAGGRSQRMGRDKSRLKLGKRTVLGHLQENLRSKGFVVKVVRKDEWGNKGPLSGVWTGCLRSTTEWTAFLACDMPEVSADLLRFLFAEKKNSAAVFVLQEGWAGFPFLVQNEKGRSAARELLDRGGESLQELAGFLRARRLQLPPRFHKEIKTFNTPEEWRTFQANKGPKRV